MRKKSKVIFMLHTPPPVHGSSVVGLAVKESKLINEEFEGYYINLLASRDVAHTGVLTFHKFVGFVLNWFRMMKILLFNRPEICYLAMTTTGIAFFRDVLMIVWVKLFRLKRVYHLHNKGIINKKDNWLYRISYKFIFKDAKVILLAKTLYADVAEFVNINDVYICANGVIDAYDEKPVIVNSEKPVAQILYLSNLIESKGVNVLVDACAILHKNGLQFECTFVGGEGDVKAVDFVERINLLGLSHIVKYVGKKYGIEKNNAFKSADIFAFPTYYSNECFPLVLLEAMSFSLPVISTYEGGIPDIVNENVTGYLVHQQNVEALAEKLEELILHPEKAILFGKNGREKYETEFTQEIFEKRLLDIMHSATGL